MKARKSGRIIVTTSVAGLLIEPGVGAAYMAAKGGAAHFMRTMALEMAKYNVTVNAIAPGPCHHEHRRWPRAPARSAEGVRQRRAARAHGEHGGNQGPRTAPRFAPPPGTSPEPRFRSTAAACSAWSTTDAEPEITEVTGRARRANFMHAQRSNRSAADRLGQGVWI